jgi:imidazolonepropionase-like amidohydrolase
MTSSAPAAPAPVPEPPARTVIRGCSLFLPDGLREADIAFDSHVREIGRDLSGDFYLDAKGGTVLPGLIDAHVHLLSGDNSQIKSLQTPLSLRFYQAIRTLRDTVQGGATWARDASGADAGVREAVRQNLLTGPRLRVAIRMIHTTGGHGDGYVHSGQPLRPFPPYPGSPDTVIDGSGDARRVARQLIRAGADVLKIAISGGSLRGDRPDARKSLMREDEIAEVVAEATAAGIPVMAHTHNAEAAATAARCGVTSVEHGTFADKQAMLTLAEHGTYLVPTLLASHTHYQRDPARFGQLHEAHLQAVGCAISAGVRIAAGTDGGIAGHGQILSEVDLLHRAGLSMTEAVRATTETGADLLGISRSYGAICMGAPADLVLIRGSVADAPLAPRLRQVWKDGIPQRGAAE